MKGLAVRDRKKKKNKGGQVSSYSEFYSVSLSVFLFSLVNYMEQLFSKWASRGSPAK